MTTFKSSAQWLDGLDPDVAAALIAAAADLTLILDKQGVILDYAFQNDSFARQFEQHDQWVGKLWQDLVTVESAPKIHDMVREASASAAVSWRQVNYPSANGGPDIPILFSTVHIGRTRCIIAFGRDLRAISSLQQRLVDAQQSLERDYSRLRHAETRYRILFQMSAEPVLILDAHSHKVAEANPAAKQLFGEDERLIGRAFMNLVDASSITAIGALFASVRATGRADDVRVFLAGTEGGGMKEVKVSAFLFRQGDQQLYLTRLSPVAETSQSLIPDNKAKLLKMIESVPDGFVVTGQDGRIIAANAAFVEMTQLMSEDQVRGQSLERWLGRPGVDLSVLLANLRQHGSVRLYPTSLRDEYGATAEVEISAVAVMTGAQPSFGFAIRGVSRRLPQEPVTDSRSVPRSLEQITELIGRVSLKELVREATSVIERLSIEAALAMTSDNRASAAEVLGLSRQSLYVKMRRYGLMDATE
jgi:transcriptional regulator PpsR